MSDHQSAERLTNVESALAHLQNDFEALNEAVLLQAKQIENLQAALKKLDEQVAESKTPEAPRDPVDEKPPHY